MKDPQFAKLVVFVNSTVPLVLLGWDIYSDPPANPASYALHTTGMLALVFLMLTLCVTPARKITGWNWLSHFRRMLGLFAFFYACLHLMIYFAFDESFSISGILRDVIRRKFILVGMSALLLMTPLAITSTNAMIKQLGAKRWKILHWLIYPTAILAVMHFYMQVKADATKPLYFAIALSLLLLYRIAESRFSFLRRRPRAVARAAA